MNENNEFCTNCKYGQTKQWCDLNHVFIEYDTDKTVCEEYISIVE